MTFVKDDHSVLKIQVNLGSEIRIQDIAVWHDSKIRLSHSAPHQVVWTEGVDLADLSEV